MKLCIIGSSHVGSLKLGWDQVKERHPAHEITFFGAVGATLRNLVARDGKLVPVDKTVADSIAYTSGGKTEIDPQAYDAFVIYGLGMRLPRLRQGISRAVMQAVLLNLSTKGPTPKIAKRLRGLTKRPLWIGPNPLEVAPNDLHDSGVFYPYAALVAEYQRVFDVPDVGFLLQPAETIGPDLRAPERFGQGSERLLSGKDGDVRAHPEDEVKHMNAEYGRLWLDHNLPLIVQGHAT